MAKWNTPTDIFELMFSKGANINIRDRGGRTPLDMAEAGGHTELVSYLIGKGAKRNSDLPQLRKPAAPAGQPAFDLLNKRVIKRRLSGWGGRFS